MSLFLFPEADIPVRTMPHENPPARRGSEPDAAGVPQNPSSRNKNPNHILPEATTYGSRTAHRSFHPILTRKGEKAVSAMHWNNPSCKKDLRSVCTRARHPSFPYTIRLPLLFLSRLPYVPEARQISPPENTGTISILSFHKFHRHALLLPDAHRFLRLARTARRPHPPSDARSLFPRSYSSRVDC